VEPAVFNVFVEWLYTQKLPVDWPGWKYVIGDTEDKSWSITETMLKVYVFADRFMVPTMRTHANRAIIAHSDSQRSSYPLPYCLDIAFAFEHLAPTDPILDFFVDLYCAYWDWEDADTYGHDKLWFTELPKEFLIRYMVKMGRMRERGDLMDDREMLLNHCSYHGHTCDEELKSCPQKKSEKKNAIWVEREGLVD